MGDPCTTHRRQSPPSCGKRSIGQAPADVPGFPPLTLQNRCPGRPCSVRARRHASEVCVARYYDPARGQFLSIDPAVAETDAPFNYAGDDPVNEVDPTGLKFNWDPFHDTAEAWSDTGGQVTHWIGQGVTVVWSWANTPDCLFNPDWFTAPLNAAY